MTRPEPDAVRRVVEHADVEDDNIAVLGRDIRIGVETIADYCITAHEPVYEDLATLIEAMSYFDRIVTRHHAGRWRRQLTIQVPMYEHGHFSRKSVVDALTRAAWFLTGDDWSFDFVSRQKMPSSRQNRLPLRLDGIKHVIPFSDGLDSFAQVRLSTREHGRKAVMLVRSGLSHDRNFSDMPQVRVVHKFGGGRKRETTYRTRPLVFYTFAAIAAAMCGANSVIIGENGQGSVGSSCVSFGNEWWFRSAHPTFVAYWSKFLGLVLQRPIHFEQPLRAKTKGEVLESLRNGDMLQGWEQTKSCSALAYELHGHRACGFCGGCLLRAMSVQAAGFSASGRVAAHDFRASWDLSRACAGVGQAMTLNERRIAVGAVASMERFARLADRDSGLQLIDREARLISSNDYENERGALLGLVGRHRAEWDGFMKCLPTDSWVRTVVEQL